MSKKLWCRKCKQFEMHDSSSQTEIERLQKRNALLEDVAVAAEKMADFIMDYDGMDDGAYQGWLDALDKLLEVGDD